MVESKYVVGVNRILISAPRRFFLHRSIGKNVCYICSIFFALAKELNVQVPKVYIMSSFSAYLSCRFEIGDSSCLAAYHCFVDHLDLWNDFRREPDLPTI